jgi:hypothetical protein
MLKKKGIKGKFAIICATAFCIGRYCNTIVNEHEASQENKNKHLHMNPELHCASTIFILL